MKKSVRRIAATMTVVGLLSLSFVTAYQAVSICLSGQNSCLVAAVTFGVSDYSSTPGLVTTTQSVTTPERARSVPTMLEFTFDLIQATSVYLILIGVILLALLEAVELRYIRMLLKSKGIKYS